MKHVLGTGIGRRMATLAALAGVATTGIGVAASRAGASDPVVLPISLDDDLLLVFLNQKAGSDPRAFASWYDRHLAEFVRMPGVRAAQRFTIEAQGRMPKDLPDNLAMYDVTAAGMRELGAESAARMKDGRLARGDAVDTETMIRVLFRPLGPATLARNVPGTNFMPLGAGAVGTHQLVVISDPAKPEMEDEFNDWYDHMHVPDVLRVPGFVSAQRFVRIGGASTMPRYLVIFTFRSGDVAATNAEIGRRIREKITRMSPTFGGANAKGAIATPAGGPVYASRH